MLNTLKSAMRDWEFEVEQESIRLIERGVPPYDAMEQAVKNVSKARERAERESKHE